MTENIPDSNEQLARQARDDLLSLGRVTLQMSRIVRAPRYSDGQRETNAEHSFHLALSATEIAARYYPNLDVGLVAQFSAVHDLPEVYAGDVWTFSISDADRAKKKDAEHAATARLLKELPSHTANLLRRYEKQAEPEARFVRFIDKLLPAIINALNGPASTLKEDFGVSSIEQFYKNQKKTAASLQSEFPEFELVHLVNELVQVDQSANVFHTH